MAMCQQIEPSLQKQKPKQEPPLENHNFPLPKAGFTNYGPQTDPFSGLFYK